MYNDIRKNENKGFSLVELIVVIAIMAVLTAVLAPSLLSYVERSRAQKDDSAMGEVANAVQLALADQDVYDEVMMFTAYGNVSCYVDSASVAFTHESPAAIITKSAANVNGADTKKDQYYFGDETRIKDEERYKAAGNMRGMTITFCPETNGNNTKYTLKNAKINAFEKTNGAFKGDNAQVSDVDSFKSINGNADIAKKTIDGMSDGDFLYNSVRATVGETIELASQTYRNSDFTVFVRMGTTGVDASTSSGIAVYGQWNGTNLDSTQKSPATTAAGGNGE